MARIVHRLRIGYEGDILEITDPLVYELDANGGLVKAVWMGDKGVKFTLEWDEKAKAYKSREERIFSKSKGRLTELEP